MKSKTIECTYGEFDKEFDKWYERECKNVCAGPGGGWIVTIHSIQHEGTIHYILFDKKAIVTHSGY